MVRVAVDAMGGDNAPAEVVKGCLEALKNSPETQVLAVGKEELIREALKGQTWDEERFTIVNATQVIGTGDAPVASIREKKDSSIVVGLKLVREGKADAFVSAGSSGALLVGGQAVGTAAAMCIKYGCGTRGVKQHMTELQQTLLKDDCYIPGYKNEDPLDLARTAKVTATSEKHAAVNVINGVARTVEENINCWQSNGIRPEGEELYLSFEQPKKVSQVRLTFDPNLNASIRLSLSSKRIAEQVPGVPPELVKDFDVELRKDGEAVAVKQVRGNYQRLNVLDFQPVECDEVVLRVLATNGIADARVYEVRVY